MLLGAVAVLVAPGGAVGRVVVVLLIACSWLVSPTFFPRSTDLEQAVARAAAGERPLVLWKPGCLYCIRLRAMLVVGPRRVSWVDSSLDAGAEALVRSRNQGDHTTPTVVFGDETRTNPEIAWVRSLGRPASRR